MTRLIVAFVVVAVLVVGVGVFEIIAQEPFQRYCRSRLYTLRNDVVDGKPFQQFVVEFTEYVDQCVEKRR